MMFRIATLTTLAEVTLAHKSSLLLRQSAFVQADQGDGKQTETTNSEAAAPATPTATATAEDANKFQQFVNSAKPHVHAAISTYGPVVQEHATNALSAARTHGTAAATGTVALVNEFRSDFPAAKTKYCGMAKGACQSFRDPKNLKWAAQKTLTKTTKAGQRALALATTPLPMLDNAAATLLSKIPEGNAVANFMRGSTGKMITGKAFQGLYVVFVVMMIWWNLFYSMMGVGVGTFFVDGGSPAAQESTVEITEITDSSETPAAGDDSKKDN